VQYPPNEKPYKISLLLRPVESLGTASTDTELATNIAKACYWFPEKGDPVEYGKRVAALLGQGSTLDIYFMDEAGSPEDSSVVAEVRYLLQKAGFAMPFGPWSVADLVESKLFKILEHKKNENNS
jgi:hypothetical protein